VTLANSKTRYVLRVPTFPLTRVFSVRMSQLKGTISTLLNIGLVLNLVQADNRLSVYNVLHVIER